MLFVFDLPTLLQGLGVGNSAVQSTAKPGVCCDLRKEGAGVRSGIRTRSQPWSSRSAVSCALPNADTARLTVLLDT